MLQQRDLEIRTETRYLLCFAWFAQFRNVFVAIKHGHDVKTVHVKYHFDDNNNNNNIIEAAHHSMKRRARYLAHLKATFCLVYVCVIPANKYYNHLRYSWKKIGFCHLQGSLTFISTMIRLSLETNAIISDKRCLLFYLHFTFMNKTNLWLVIYFIWMITDKIRYFHCIP